MAILKKIYPLLVLPLLTGCEEVFTPDMPHTPVLSVNSLITAGEPIEASVSKSRLYTDTASNATVVKDAVVNIYSNGQLQLDSYIPKEGDDIRITVQSPTSGQVDAKVTIPSAVPIADVKWTTSDVEIHSYQFGEIELNRWEHNISFKLNVELTILDPPGENYYKLGYGIPDFDGDSDEDGNYSFSGNYGLWISGLQYNLEPIFSEHIGIFESIMGGDAEGFTFFTDRQFSGKSYTLHLQFDKCVYRCIDIIMPDPCLQLNLFSVSPSYYNWANYVWQRDNGSLTDFSDYGLGDPIWGYSNVSSGAGVVAAQSKSVCTIDLTDFIQETIKTNNQIE